MPLDPSQPYPKRARLKDKVSYLGIRGYFITINAHRRRKFFTQKNVVASLVRYLQEASTQEAFEVVAYCFMPDHLHLVLTGMYESSDLERFIRQFKQFTGYRFKKQFGVRLWATSYYDNVLRKEENIKTVGRYVLKNPLRAGLVSNVLDYPFSGSFVYDLRELFESDPYLLSDEEIGQS